MKKNINLLLASILVITLATLSFVSAATGTIDFITPTASQRISGDFISYVSNASANSFNTIDNCTFYIKSTALTANTTWVVLNNTAENTTLYNVTGILPTTIVEDGTDYTLNVTCYNRTSDFATDTVTVTVDNTVPSTPTLSPVTGTTDTDGTINFTGTVTGSSTTGCTLYFEGTNPGASSYAMTHAGSSCAYQLTNLPETTYKWYIENSDGTNTTNSATAELRVDTTNSKAGISGEGLVQDQSGFVVTAEQEAPNWVVPLIVVIAVLGIGYLIARRK